MKFVEVEYIVSRNAKKIHKMLIRRDTILSIRFTHSKNPVLYYSDHTGICSQEFDTARLAYLTQESYEKLKKQLLECE